MCSYLNESFKPLRTLKNQSKLRQFFKYQITLMFFFLKCSISVYWYLVIECEEQDNVLQKDDKVQEMFDLVRKESHVSIEA